MSCTRIYNVPKSPTASEDALNGTSLLETDSNLTALIALSHKEKEEAVRKQRLSDSLASLRNRLDTCEGTFNVELLIAKELTSKFGRMERALSFGVLALGLVTMIIALTRDIDMVLLIASGCACGTAAWFYHASKDKKKIAFEAIHALQIVSKGLDDLHSGIGRCETVLLEDLQSDTEWQEQEEIERRQWEEERREVEKLQLERVNLRFQELHPELQKVKTTKEEKRAAVLNKRRTLAKDKSMSKSRSFRNIFASFKSPKEEVKLPEDKDEAAIVGLDAEKEEPPFPSNSSRTWMDYVNVALPLERLARMTDADRDFSKQVREKTEGRWDEIPLDLKLMALRAWETRKDRLDFTVEQVEYIVNWRHKSKADEMLSSASDPTEERFFGSWKTRFGGEDIYGHPIVYDRVEDFDLDFLYSLSDDQVLTCHTKQMEVLRRRKLDIGQNRHQRVCKHVYILDLKGLSLNKHFTSRMKNLLVSIFKVEGTAYPDSLWSLWLINTPMVFKLIWSALSPGIDPASKAKIRMKGDSKDYLPEMERCGIPITSMPEELGGQYSGITYWTALKDIIDHDTGGVKQLNQALNQTF